MSDLRGEGGVIESNPTEFRIGARCPSKVRYRDKVGALIAAARLEAEDKPDHPERRPYHCPHCNGWHLTSQAKRA